MKICGAILIAAIVLSISHFWNKKMTAIVLTACSLLTAASIFNELSIRKDNISTIEKNESGDGSTEKQLIAETQDGQEVEIDVTIPEKKYGMAEAQRLLDEEMSGLESVILGENSSFDEICHDMILPNTGTNPNISIAWTSLNPDVISSDGKIQEDIPEEGSKAVLSAILRLQDEECEYKKEIYVYPNVGDGSLRSAIQNEVERQNANNNGDEYILPESVDGEKLIWHETAGNSFAIVSFLLLAVGVLLKFNKGQKLEEQRKKRNECLKREYPELISRLLLMLYSGISVRSAFFRLSDLYVKSRNAGGERYEVFEEMIVACRAMNSGSTEEEAYKAMAERCSIPCYRKLSVLLIQNVRRGGKGFTEALEQEVVFSFGERKRAAEMAGEAASLKLLIPLGMMLIVALAVMMVPAFLSM